MLHTSHIASQEMRLEPDTVPAILAIKRFVRGTLKQVSISVLSLMLVIGVTTHSAAVDSIVDTEVNGQAATWQTDRTLPANSHRLLDRSFAKEPTTHTQRTRPRRMLHASVLHHHLTGARLSTAAITHHTHTQIADAE